MTKRVHKPVAVVPVVVREVRGNAPTGMWGEPLPVLRTATFAPMVAHVRADDITIPIDEATAATLCDHDGWMATTYELVLRRRGEPERRERRTPIVDVRGDVVGHAVEHVVGRTSSGADVVCLTAPKRTP